MDLVQVPPEHGGHVKGREEHLRQAVLVEDSGEVEGLADHHLLSPRRGG